MFSCQFYDLFNEILTDHNLHPVHKEDIPDANLVLEGYRSVPLLFQNLTHEHVGSL